MMKRLPPIQTFMSTNPWDTGGWPTQDGPWEPPGDGGGGGGGGSDEPPIPMNHDDWNDEDFDGVVPDAFDGNLNEYVERSVDISSVLSDGSTPTRIDNTYEPDNSNQVYYGSSQGYEQWIADIAFTAFQQQADAYFADVSRREAHQNQVAASFSARGVQVTRGPGGSVWVPAEAVTGQSNPGSSPGEILVIARRPDNVTSIPMPLVFSTDSVNGPTAQLVNIILKYPNNPGLEARGVKFVTKLSPRSYNHIAQRHFGDVGGKTTWFLPQYTSVAWLDVLIYATLSDGAVMGVTDERGIIGINWTAPLPIGTNRFGDPIYTVRVVLYPNPTGNGIYDVYTMYPVGDRK